MKGLVQAGGWMGMLAGWAVVGLWAGLAKGVEETKPAGRVEPPVVRVQGARAQTTGAASSQAEGILRQMCQTMSGLESFSVEVSQSLSVEVGVVGQSLTEQASLTVARPRRLALVGTEGLTRPAVYCDANQVITYLAVEREYVQEAAPADLEGLFAREGAAGRVLSMGLPVLRVLLSSDPAGQLLTNAQGTEYLGRETLEGVSYHRVRLKYAEADLDFWVETGERALLRRFAPDLSGFGALVGGSGRASKIEQRWDLTNWQVSPEAGAARWAWAPPAGARRVKELSIMAEAAPRHPLEGQAAPAFELPILGGGTAELAKHRGKEVVVLDFWATWCPPCRKWLPQVEELAGEFRDKGVVFYAVDGEETAEKVREYLEKNGFKLPVALDQDGSVGRLYQVTGIPQTVVIGKDGVAAKVYQGVPEDLRQVRELLDGLLSGRGRPALSCLGLTFVPQPARANAPATFRCELRNGGATDASAGSYQVQLEVDGVPVFLAPGPADVPAGRTATFTVPAEVWHFQVNTPGKYTYKLTVDPQRRVSAGSAAERTKEGVLEVQP